MRSARLNDKIAAMKSQMAALKEIEASGETHISLADPGARSMMTRGSGIVAYKVQTAEAFDEVARRRRLDGMIRAYALLLSPYRLFEATDVFPWSGSKQTWYSALNDLKSSTTRFSVYYSAARAWFCLFTQPAPTADIN